MQCVEKSLFQTFVGMIFLQSLYKESTWLHTCNKITLDMFVVLFKILLSRIPLQIAIRRGMR